MSMTWRVNFESCLSVSRSHSRDRLDEKSRAVGEKSRCFSRDRRFAPIRAVHGWAWIALRIIDLQLCCALIAEVSGRGAAGGGGKFTIPLSWMVESNGTALLSYNLSLDTLRNANARSAPAFRRAPKDVPLSASLIANKHVIINANYYNSNHTRPCSAPHVKRDRMNTVRDSVSSDSPRRK